MITEDHDKLTVLCTKVDHIVDVVDKLETVVIRGNGRPSILSRLDALESATAVKVAIVTSLGSLGAAIAAIVLA